MSRTTLLAIALFLILGGLMVRGHSRYAVPFQEGRQALAAFRAAIEEHKSRTGAYPVNTGQYGLAPLRDGEITPWLKEILSGRDTSVNKRHIETAQRLGAVYYSDGTDCLFAFRDVNYHRIAWYLDRLATRSCPDCLFTGFWTAKLSQWCPQPYQARIADLYSLREALDKYHKDRGSYPVSRGFAGISSRYGDPDAQYIRGLAPAYIAALPRAPADEDRTFDGDYLYRSDGRDYKLVSLSSRDCALARTFSPGFADPSPECACIGVWTEGAKDWRPSFTPRRLLDLETLSAALEAYHRDHGAYPKSQGLDGLYSAFGRSAPDWIPGLAPKYIPTLPRDPRINDDPSNQYLYASDGKDYKLIAHHPEDCEEIKKERPELIDPARDCQAWGFFTPGGKNW